VSAGALPKFALSILIKGGIPEGGADPAPFDDAGAAGVDSAPLFPPPLPPPPLDGVGFFFPFFGMCASRAAKSIDHEMQPANYKENISFRFLAYYS
jgi:hypothetical protein